MHVASNLFSGAARYVICLYKILFLFHFVQWVIKHIVFAKSAAVNLLDLLVSSYNRYKGLCLYKNKSNGIKSGYRSGLSIVPLLAVHLSRYCSS